MAAGGSRRNPGCRLTCPKCDGAQANRTNVRLEHRFRDLAFSTLRISQ
jgi:hypothetical protein